MEARQREHSEARIPHPTFQRAGSTAGRTLECRLHNWSHSTQQAYRSLTQPLPQREKTHCAHGPSCCLGLQRAEDWPVAVTYWFSSLLAVRGDKDTKAQLDSQT